MATNSTLKYERVDRQSAQVISNITDLSRITETVPGYASVAVITAPKGPTDVAVLLRSTDDLVNTFGNPTGDHIQLLCVYGMLQRGKACWVVRVADPFYAANSKALLSKDKLLNPVDGTNNKYVDNGFTNLSDKTNKFVASDMGAFKGLGAYNLNPDHPIDNVTIPELVKTIPGNDSELAKVVLYGVIDEKVDITDDGTVRSFSIPATTHVVVENVGAEKLEVGKVKLSVAVGREDSEDSTTVIDGVGILDYVLNASDVVEVEETEDGPDKMFFKCVPVGSGESVSYNLELDIGFIAPGLELSETPEIPSDYAEKGILDIDQDEWTWNVHTSVSVNDGSPVVSSVKYMAVYETGTGSDKKTFMSMFPAVARMEAKTSGSELNGSNIHFENVTKDQARILNEKRDDLRKIVITDKNLNTTSRYVSFNKKSPRFIEDVFSEENTDTSCVFTLVGDDRPADNTLFFFRNGDDGNSSRLQSPIVEVKSASVNSEGETVYVTVGSTTPVIGYIDDNGNATGMHVFLNKGIVAQTFPALGFYDESTLEAMKAVADEREDLTCLFDTPPNLPRALVIEWADSLCNRNESLSTQAFNCRFYWDWVYDDVQNVEYLLPPSGFVAVNTLDSFEKNGPWHPVAGSARGVLDVNGVSTKLPIISARDELVSHRINPIYDTGNNGIQIYGNETLNYEYTDLRSAHIGATLTYIRSAIDAYTETVKFSLNNSALWNSWQDYVMTNILNPIVSAGGLAFARASMGASITTAEELAKRQVRGLIELQFVQDAEVFLLNYVVYASSADTNSL